jgi:hypothetical protein
MVIFAVLGAVTAYRGAKTEQDALVVAEKLAQGQLIEVGERQRLQTQRVSSAALAIQEREIRSLGLALTQSAAIARQENRSEDAAWLTMRAHEQFAVARTIRLVRDEFVSSNLSADQENLRVAGNLAELGFGAFVHFQATENAVRPTADHSDRTLCHQSAGVELSQIWCKTRQQLEELHERVRIFALAVAGFVLALTLFTVSDASVNARWRQLKWVFLGAGLSMGILAIAVALVWGDGTAWPWLLGGLIATPALWLGLLFGVSFAERKGWVHPESGEGAVHPEEMAYERAVLRAPVLGHHIGHRFGVITVILIAVTVFVSAAVGWGYSVANTHADGAAEAARKSAAEMVIRNTLFASKQSELVREVAATFERRARLASANQRIQLSSFGGSMKSRYGDEDARHANEQQTYKGLFRDLDQAIDEPNLSIDDDPKFPNRLLWQFLRIPLNDSPLADDASRQGEKPYERNRRSRNAHEAFAQWNLESGLSVSWRNVATGLLAALTIFAISLYFLGQALAMEPTRSGYVLLTAGIVFGCFGVGSSLISAYPMVRLAGLAQVTPTAVGTVLADNDCPEVYSDFSDGPGRSRELAAYFYSVGTVLSETESDESDLRRSERYFKCALALNGDFFATRLRLASVNSRLGSLDFKEPYWSLPDRKKLQRILDLSRTAQDLLQRSGLDLSAGKRNSLAFDTALVGLMRGDDQALGLADTIAREALESAKDGKIFAKPDTVALLQTNLGFVRLARGQFDAGRKAYQDGLAQDPENELRASALTDLEMVKVLRCNDATAASSTFDCAGLLVAIADVKKIMLARQPVEGPARLPGVSEEDFKVSTKASRLIARLRGVDLDSDDLWLVWSRMEPSWGAWRTLQRISQPITTVRKGDDTVTVHDGTIVVQHSFMRSYRGTNECIVEGRYRAELYSHGVLVAPFRFLDQPILEMKPARFRELNVELCIPGGWSVIPEKAAAVVQRSNYGTARGLQNSAGRVVSFIFTFNLPTHSDGLASCLIPKNAVNCAISTLTAGKLISGSEPRLSFEDMAGSVAQGALVYRTWTTPNGGVHVVIAKADAAPADQLWNMLASAEVIYDENEVESEAQK